MYGATQTFKTIKFGSNATILTSRGEAISLEDIAANAPAVFAEGAHDSRSERYEFLNTRTVLEGLQREGFEVFEVRQGGSRIEGKREFTKHMLRLRYMGEAGQAAIVGRGDRAIPEVIITNAHDGTASWQIGAGLFRIVCANGLVSGEMFEYTRIGHTKSAPEKVIDASYRVIEQMPKVISGANDMAAISLRPEEQLVFANAARQLRWDHDAPVTPDRLLGTRRQEDRLADLWTTMNVVQENVIRGGIGYTRRNPETGRTSHRSTGEIRGIDDNNRLNRALWTLAEGMANLKAA
jgi:hypothetical protein